MMLGSNSTPNPNKRVSGMAESGLFASAVMDRVFKDCKHGLIENIRFLYRMMVDLKAKGYKVFAVGKAYDDDLYAWVYGGGRDVERNMLKWRHLKLLKGLRIFERFSYRLHMASLSIANEALKGIRVGDA